MGEEKVRVKRTPSLMTTIMMNRRMPPQRKPKEDEARRQRKMASPTIRQRLMIGGRISRNARGIRSRQRWPKLVKPGQDRGNKGVRREASSGEKGPVETV